MGLIRGYQVLQTWDMPSNEPKPYEYWIVVVELDDVVERRDPSKPNLRLEVTRTHPLTRFDRLKRSKRKTWYLGSVQKLREDLMPKSAFPDRVSAMAALKLLRDQLNEDGYTVDRNTRVWQVYVLELDSSGIANPGEGHVYVGETSLSPEIRLQQHRGELLSKKGKSLAARSIKVPIIGLWPELAPQEFYYSKAQATYAEARLAKDLQNKGYLVLGGH
jgi:hypothetical protein